MTPPDEPFDQDEPKGRGRPSGKPSGRSSRRPAGEGWDHGRGNRPTGARRQGSGRPTAGGRDRGNRGARDGGRRGSGARGSSNGGKTRTLDGLPVWVLPAAGALLVLIVLMVILRSCSGDSDRSDAGSCLTDLLAHLPASTTAAAGTDLVQARKAGYDESGSLEEVGESLEVTGAIPDPVSSRYRFSQLTTVEQFEARTGFTPADAECALTSGNRSVLSGSFDPVVVEGSQAGSDGDLAATEDLLAMGTGSVDPKEILEPAEDDGFAGDDAVVTALERVRDDGAYSVIAQRGGGGNRALAAAIGVGGSGDELVIPITWVYKNPDAAKAGRADVVDKVNTALRGTVSIDTTDLVLEDDLVTAVIPTREAPNLSALVDRAVRLVEPPE